ncbi:GGDEF domain-containing protein [Actinoplanes sp. NEAU-A12]|uniref:GGDEF domain-containing protein n=1 Tax=Actinoplanes sandaracinus TaxID=3045177 RepID=A0ABT6WPW7_9ACTN|nr:GGDEF domain-containing protein [Actinoplanes sandaracinus]MDI6101801.1 GGDEF domain-containing protein [Actinoplanes sandaracinus]
MNGDSLGTVQRSRRQSLRASAAYGAVPGVLAAAYAIGTWSSAGRGPMLSVAAALVLFAAFGWAMAGRIARTRWWIWIQVAASAVSLAGSAVLGLLDGGVGGPLGTFIPLSVVLMAIALPPRMFVVSAGLGVVAYTVLLVSGDPPPAGYPLVHALGFASVAVLSLRHSAVLASLRRRLADSSRTDPLTGCLNRRGFDERVAAELAEAESTGAPVTLVLLDLDHFKQVNDTYGHRAGDELLAWTGKELRAELRAHDVVGRQGGDEFVMLMPGMDAAGAVTVVERLRERLRACAPGSLGHATLTADAPDYAGLLLVADQRLYQDKAARVRRAPTAEAVAGARSLMGPSGPMRAVEARERRRHSIADPGWMSITQTCVALVYALVFVSDHAHRAGMVALSAWGFLTGLAVVAGAGWMSRSRLARPFMLAFAVSSFVCCGAIAVLDGGVDQPLGIGMLLPIPLLMLGMRPEVMAPVAVAAGGLYVLAGVFVGDPGGWYIAIQVLGTAAAATACAMQGRSAARQRRLLTKLSRVDALTDVLNRRGFAERFAAETAYARRTGRDVALLVLDLDGFKRLNDAHGHAAGDELLRWVAATLRAGTHPHDIVGRLGGDEFVILLSTDGAGDDPFAVAAGLRATLAARTGVSIGVAVLGVAGDDFDDLYAIADARLYHEKQLVRQQQKQQARRYAGSGRRGNRLATGDHPGRHP